MTFARQHELLPLSVLRESRLGAQLSELACGSRVAEQTLIRLLAESNAEILTAMQRALAEQRWPALAAEAHRLLGAAQLIGWCTLGRLTRQVGAAARAHAPETAHAALDVLGHALGRLDLTLMRLLDAHEKARTESG